MRSVLCNKKAPTHLSVSGRFLFELTVAAYYLCAARKPGLVFFVVPDVGSETFLVGVLLRGGHGIFLEGGGLHHAFRVQNNIFDLRC